jgi:OmpA-OmpF porin, OOP family
LGYPVDGLYIGVAGGFNLKGNESIKNLSSNGRPFSSGLSTPNLSAALDLGGAAVGEIGWGFGNGLRAEVEFNWRENSFSHVSGSEQLWGPMFNADYDFVGLVPWVIPYVGVGIGYQRVHLSNFEAFGTGTATALSPVLGSNDTRASFAV